MSDDEFFQAALDRSCEDAAARLLLAEWLGERGDGQAAGYRRMGEAGMYPYFRNPTKWGWVRVSAQSASAYARHLVAAEDAFDAANGPNRWASYSSRREAEEAV